MSSVGILILAPANNYKLKADVNTLNPVPYAPCPLPTKTPSKTLVFIDPLFIMHDQILTVRGGLVCRFMNTNAEAVEAALRL